MSIHLVTATDDECYQLKRYSDRVYNEAVLSLLQATVNINSDLHNGLDKSVLVVHLADAKEALNQIEKDLKP